MRVIVQILLTFVLNASWQVTLIVAFAVACDRLLRGVTARYRHCLWVFTLIACLAVSALSCLTLGKATNHSEPQPQRSLGPTPVVTARILTPGVEDATSGVPESQPPQSKQGGRAISFPLSIRVRPFVAFTIVGLYLLVFLWRVSVLVRAWRRTKYIVAGAFECAFPGSVTDLIQKCQTEVGAKPCRILCSTELAVPITVGVFDRLIILPERFACEISPELLISAVGHEFQHIVRHDYLLNLIYEIIYLPLSFHPAASFARRRIKHTRELCCDAAVTTKLIKPEIYARALVTLIGSAPLHPLAPDTTIGMNESDILEVRIMSLLKSSKLSPRRRTLLLIAAALLLVMPCVAAARFALSFDTKREPPPGGAELQQKKEAEQGEKQERITVELEQQASALKEQIQRAPQAQRAEIEAKLREVQRNLEEHQRELERFAQMKEQIAKSTDSAVDEAVKRELKEKLEAEQKLSQLDRKARLIHHTEAEYSADAREKKIEGNVVLGFTIDHDGLPQNIQIKKSLYPSLDQKAIEAVRTWRFEPAMKGGQPVSMWVQAEINFRLDYGPQSQEEREAREKREKEEREKTQSGGQELRVRLNDEAARRAEREAEQKRDTQLAKLARISMDQAIQIATSKTPGKVTQCSLVGEHWEGPGELAKPALVLYHVIILAGDESNPVTYHVLVNAMDGSIFRNEKEERRQEMTEGYAVQPRILEGGVLNTKAASLPMPAYPAIARAAHADGDVQVRIMIDEGGNVIEATALSGHPLLRATAVNAARQAKFNPTRLQGEPVRVTGLLVYNFLVQ